MGINLKPFWMVHGAGPTSHRHSTRSGAVTEAERLARLHPNAVFVVLEAVEAVRKVDVERISLRADRGSGTTDDIPF